MKRLLLLLLLLSLLLAACAPGLQEQTLYAMDTVMQLRVYGKSDVLPELTGRLRSLDSLLSATQAQSEVYQLNQSGQMTVSEDLSALLRQSLALNARTQGALDVSVYGLVCLWGFPTKDYRVPSEEERSSALAHIGADHIKQTGNTVCLDPGTQLDFGAVAKGYAADACQQLLRQSQTDAAVLALGGNILTYGNRPDGGAWRIGISDPDAPEQYFAELHLSGTQHIVTSGSYQRYFEQNGKRYHHIFDPKTGLPADNGLVSVTVVAQSGLLADGLSTALFVMGPEKAWEFYRASQDFEAVLRLSDGRVYVTQGLADCVSGCAFEVISR